MSLQTGDVIEGKITGITNFGLFVDIGSNENGLIHISEVAEGYVKNLQEMFAIGQIVRAKVVNTNNRGKVALSIKQLIEKKVNTSNNSFRKNNRQDAPMENKTTFEDKLTRFLKDSDEKLSDYKRKTDAKRGGRGGRHA